MVDDPHHPNAMIYWEAIGCTLDHDSHDSVAVRVDLSVPHGYHDLPAVPDDLARQWDMMVYDPDLYPVGAQPSYCPAHDAVSSTICSEGIWEPRETILASRVLKSAQPGQTMFDIGAQLGWFSLLAAAWGVPAFAFDADPANIEMLGASCALNGWSSPGDVTIQLLRVGPDTEQITAAGDPPAVRFVKIDLEGAEDHAVRMLYPLLEAGLVDHLMMEVSPCFADYYPMLVTDLIDLGYEAYRLPDKQSPPASLDDPDNDLIRLDDIEPADLRDEIATWRQEDVWLRRQGADW